MLAGRRYKQIDLELTNARGHTFKCSHYLPAFVPENIALPCVIYAMEIVSPNTVIPQGCLAHDLIEKVEVEVRRLKHLKASKMKELVLKKMTELEEIYRSVHMDIVSDHEWRILTELIDSEERCQWIL